MPHRMSLYKKEHSGVEIQASDNKRSLVFRDWSHGAFAFYLTNSALLNKRVLSQNKTLVNWYFLFPLYLMYKKKYASMIHWHLTYVLSCWCAIKTHLQKWEGGHSPFVSAYIFGIYLKFGYKNPSILTPSDLVDIAT